MHRHRDPAPGRRLTGSKRRSAATTTRISVRLTPNGGVDRVDGVAGGLLRARVAARAVDGAANEALIRLLANELDLARSTISIVRGTTARLKVVQVDGVDARVLRSRWPGIEV